LAYKLVVVDLDGTLLDDNQSISEKNYKVISKLKEKNISFVLASGRPYQSLEEYAAILKLKLPVISTNGALIKNIADSEIVFKSLLSFKDAEKIFNYGLKNNFSVIVYYPDEFLSTDQKTAIYQKDMEGIDVKYRKELRKNKRPLKIVFKAEAEKIKSKLGEVNNIFASDFCITQSDEHYIEFMNKGISKGRGIDYLMENYNLKREEIISIGNNFNDISMLDNSGLAVAMGNSPEAVKKRADLITKSNEEDGVAAILEEIFAENLI